MDENWRKIKTALMNSDNAVSFFSSPLSVHHHRRGSRRLLELSRAGSSLACPSCSWPSWMLLLLFLRHQNRPTLPLLFLFFLAAPPSVILCSPARLASTEQSQVNSFSPKPRLILAMLPTHLPYCYRFVSPKRSKFATAESPWSPRSPRRGQPYVRHIPPLSHLF